MSMISKIPLSIPKYPYPWTTAYISREHAGGNQDRLTGHAVLGWARDSQLSEAFYCSSPSCKSGVKRDLEAQGRK